MVVGSRKRVRTRLLLSAARDGDRHCKTRELSIFDRGQRPDFRRRLPEQDNLQPWRSGSDVRPTSTASKKSFPVPWRKFPAKQNTFVRGFLLLQQKFQ